MPTVSADLPAQAVHLLRVGKTSFISKNEKKVSLTKQEMRDVHIEFPKWIVWENVTGALSSNGGSDFGHVLDSLAHLGGPLEISVDGLPKFSAVEFGSNHETHTSRLPSVCRLAPTVMRSVLRCAICLLYTSPSPRDGLLSRMPSSA